MKFSQKPLMKCWSNTISTYKVRNEDDPLCADECYTIKKNSCKIHWLSNEMCELYNLFTKSCKADIQKASDFYTLCNLLNKTRTFQASILPM